MKNALFFVLILTVLSACSSINYVNIETYKPAEITFPTRVNKVLIVNNAVPQPADMGYEYTFMGTKQDTARAKADSALFETGRALGRAILDTDYFNDVLLFHEATRKDDQYFSDEKLTQKEVQALCEENDVDAIISIDRLLFDMTKHVNAVGNSFFVGVINIKLTGVMRAYIPERATSLATVLLSDSVFWAEEAETPEKLNIYLPNADNALREAGKYIANLAAPNFVPHWQNEIRWFYTGGTTEWKQATAYASHQKWTAAEPIWRSIHANAKNHTQKAKSASNIAFSQEMQGNYIEALEWAEKALPLFKAQSDSSNDYKLLYQYIITLRERIRENQKLIIQFEGI